MQNSIKLFLFVFLSTTIIFLLNIDPRYTYAQNTATVIINLNEGRENAFDEGTLVYDGVSNIETNSSEIQGIEAGSGTIYNSVSDDTIRISFPAKIPDPINPNKVSVIDASIWLDVNSIETTPDGLKIYYGESGFLPSNIGELEVVKGTLEQISNDQAVATLVLG